MDRGDGATACRLLTPYARQQVESSEGKPCRRAILSSTVGRPPVDRVETYIISGFVRLDDGERLYLDQTPLGWRVSAAGCRPPGGASPDECQVGLLTIWLLQWGSPESKQLGDQGHGSDEEQKVKGHADEQRRAGRRWEACARSSSPIRCSS